MESQKFKRIRARLGKTQKEMAHLLGVSIKAIHSYEQEWRKIPHHVERQLLFLLSRLIEKGQKGKQCWDLTHCPTDKKAACAAREFKAGDLCWFINGTQFEGKAHSSWENKMKKCRSCKVFLTCFESEQGILNNE